MNIDKFLAETQLAEETQRGYRNTLRRFERWLMNQDPSLQEPANETAKAWIQTLRDKELSQNSLIYATNALRSYMKWAEIPCNLRAPKVEMEISEDRYITDEEVSKLLAAANTPLEEAIIKVLYDSAMRIGEMLSITRDGVGS